MHLETAVFVGENSICTLFPITLGLPFNMWIRNGGTIKQNYSLTFENIVFITFAYLYFDRNFQQTVADTHISKSKTAYYKCHCFGKG